MAGGRKYWTLRTLHWTDKKAQLRSDVEEIGYKPNANLTRWGLVALMQHHEAGYLCYDKCTDNELKTFSINRGLISKTSKATRARLINLLFKADSDPSFSLFCDLPPELRTHVYDIYIADLTKCSLKNPVEPPLARVDRLLRSESLVHFYQACTFCISIEGSWLSCLRVTDATKRFLHKLSDLKLKNIRNLDIAVAATLCTFDAYVDDITRTLMRASIEFSPGMDACSINCVVLESDRLFPLKNDAATIEGKVKEVFGEIVGRQGPHKLKASDLISLDGRELKVF